MVSAPPPSTAGSVRPRCTDVNGTRRESACNGRLECGAASLFFGFAGVVAGAGAFLRIRTIAGNRRYRPHAPNQLDGRFGIIFARAVIMHLPRIMGDECSGLYRRGDMLR